MVLYSFMLVPMLALGGLIEAIGGFIIPAIFVIIWIVSAIANQAAKAKKGGQSSEPSPEAQAQLAERRRRMEEALGLPQDSLRGPGEPTPPPTDRSRDTVRPVIGGRVAMPPEQQRPQPGPVRTAPVRQPPPRPTPPPVKRSPATPVTAAQTGEIGSNEIGSDEIGGALQVVLARPKKRRHPIAELLRNPKTVRQAIAAREVLDRPQW